ncbi:MAG: uL15 family ribosomal protein [bacterium]|jgi:large subunit ribosomal protein L15
MQLHNLKAKTKRKTSNQIGRGGKRGKTSGRGTKGQKARAGHKIRPELRDYIKKLPKLRGHGKNTNFSIQTKPVIINLGDLGSVYKAGDTVSPTTLIQKGLLSTAKGRNPSVKILSNGEISIKLSFKNCTVSEGAKTLIEKAGGTVEAMKSTVVPKVTKVKPVKK